MAPLGEINPHNLPQLNLPKRNLMRDEPTRLLLRANGTRPPAQAAAGLVGVHLPSIRRRRG